LALATLNVGNKTTEADYRYPNTIPLTVGTWLECADNITTTKQQTKMFNLDNANTTDIFCDFL